MTNNALSQSNIGYISVSPSDSIYTVFRIIISIIVFIISHHLAKSRKNAEFIIKSIGNIGFIFAVYGIISFEVDPTRMLWVEKIVYQESVTATFVNRNTYGTYAGLALCSLISVAYIDLAKGIREKSIRRTIDAGIVWVLGRGGWLLFKILIISTALIMTGSRGAIISSFLALLLLSLLQIFIYMKRQKTNLIVTFLLFSIICFTYNFYGTLFWSRLEFLNTSSESRWEVYLIAWRAIQANWLFGYGLGTFMDVFNMVRDSTVDSQGIWQRAHNVYLELFLAVGIPMGIIGLSGFFIIFYQQVRNIMLQTADTATFASFSAMVLIGLHSLADFSIQSDGVSLSFAAILGAGATVKERIIREN